MAATDASAANLKRRRREWPWMLWFLGALILVVMAYPIAAGGKWRLAAFNLFENAVLAGAIIIILRRTRALVPAAVGLGAVIITSWFNFLWWRDAALELAMVPAWIAVDGFAAAAVLVRVLGAKKHGVHEIGGAAAGYILLGLMFSSVFRFIEEIRPGSFVIECVNRHAPIFDNSAFVIYSFATLTSAGYSDVEPATAAAQTFTILASLTGMFYMAVLVGSLVGLYLHRRTREAEGDRPAPKN